MLGIKITEVSLVLCNSESKYGSTVKETLVLLDEEFVHLLNITITFVFKKTCVLWFTQCGVIV